MNNNELTHGRIECKDVNVDYDGIFECDFIDYRDEEEKNNDNDNDKEISVSNQHRYYVQFDDKLLRNTDYITFNFEIIPFDKRIQKCIKAALRTEIGKPQIDSTRAVTDSFGTLSGNYQVENVHILVFFRIIYNIIRSLK